MATVEETRYALSGDVHIAYQVTGDGPFDLVFVPGFVTHMELQWKLPAFGDFLSTLGSFARLIRFDKRGTGMSDPVSGAPSLETRMDDVRAVMDAAGSRRAAFYGLLEGAAMSILFAATYPERVAALIVRSCSPRTMWAPDFPWGRSAEAHEHEGTRRCGSTKIAMVRAKSLAVSACKANAKSSSSNTARTSSKGSPANGGSSLSDRLPTAAMTLAAAGSPRG
jgi:pimeloyl-ACP methyl ester carboxylesterase